LSIPVARRSDCAGDSAETLLAKTFCPNERAAAAVVVALTSDRADGWALDDCPFVGRNRETGEVSKAV
jgi:hypothetical protein